MKTTRRQFLKLLGYTAATAITTATGVAMMAEVEDEPGITGAVPLEQEAFGGCYLIIGYDGITKRHPVSSGQCAQNEDGTWDLYASGDGWTVTATGHFDDDAAESLKRAWDVYFPISLDPPTYTGGLQDVRLVIDRPDQPERLSYSEWVRAHWDDGRGL
jgi:hypothetical protein